jgi:hypothetical protein
MRKTQVYRRHKCICDDHPVSIIVQTVNDHQLWQMTKHWLCAKCYTKWPTKEYSGVISRSRNISWKCWHYSSQRFERALPLLTFGCKNAISRIQRNMSDSCWKPNHYAWSRCYFFNNTASVSTTGKYTEKTMICEFRGNHCKINKCTHRYRKMVTRNTSKSFTNVGRCVSVPMRTTLKEMLCK